MSVPLIHLSGRSISGFAMYLGLRNETLVTILMYVWKEKKHSNLCGELQMQSQMLRRRQHLIKKKMSGKVGGIKNGDKGELERGSERREKRWKTEQMNGSLCTIKLNLVNTIDNFNIEMVLYNF